MSAGTPALAATPNLQRRLRLLESVKGEDFREGAPLLLTDGIAGRIAVSGAVAGSILGFSVEANDPAMVGVGDYSQPVFGGGGKDGGPFVIDVHPGNATRGQCLCAIAHDGATFIMDYLIAGVPGTPPIEAVGADFDLFVNADNGAAGVDGTVFPPVGATTVRCVNLVTSVVDQNAPDPKRHRVEVMVITPQLNG